MRMTINLDEDVAAAVERLRQERGEGLSRVVNDLVRKGLREQPRDVRFEQVTSSMRARFDVTNVSEAIELIEGPAAG